MMRAGLSVMVVWQWYQALHTTVYRFSCHLNRLPSQTCFTGWVDSVTFSQIIVYALVQVLFCQPLLQRVKREYGENP
jgi:hypothetical protein